MNSGKAELANIGPKETGKRLLVGVAMLATGVVLAWAAEHGVDMDRVIPDPKLSLARGAIKPWTTYELIQQVERTLRRVWPRAQSKLYEEPKKLVAHGFATATDDPVGRQMNRRVEIIFTKG